jgi:hypothetical protein
MTSYEHSWSQPPPYGSRSYQSPVPWCPSTVTHLPGDLGLMFQPHYGSKCSSPSTSCPIQAPEQRRN